MLGLLMGGGQGEHSTKLHYELDSRYIEPSNNSRYWAQRMAQQVRGVDHQYLEPIFQKRIQKVNL